jgi:UDP-N-acetylmuramate--alanine ligase
MTRVLFAGGGTGGHLYPALAIEAAMRALRADLESHFVGARRGIEARVLPERGVPHTLLPIEPIRRDRPWRNWRLVPALVRSLLAVRSLCARFRPHVFVGTGGYASGPAALVAHLRGVPIVLQEQNAYPGLVTRWMAPRARQIHLGFPEAAAHLKPGPGTEVLESGNPIRIPDAKDDRARARIRLGLPADATVALVTGGSQGALAINRSLSDAIAAVARGDLPAPPADLVLLWVTGPDHLQAVRDGLAAAGSPEWVRLEGYLNDMPAALSAADLAVSRAGASTTGELLAWGIPSILIPLPTAAADHQRVNAEALAAAGAAQVLDQAEATPERLWRALMELAADPAARARMAERARERARPHAAESIAADVLALADRASAGADARRSAGSEDEVDLVALARTGPVHLVGVAGAGMSVLAELILRSGGAVSGCDLRPGAIGKALRDRGARVEQGHDPAHVEDAVAVVTTAAVPADHPELARARARGIPVMKRARALGALVNRGTVVGVAGTHGKTTTTAMTAAILDAAGLDPTAMVGGRIDAWGGGLRLGGGDLFVVEADEYDRSFHALRPTVAIVTNLEADHLDIYGSLEAVEDAFDTYVAALPADGLLIACADDPGAARLVARHAGAPVLTYGTGEAADLRATDVRSDAQGSTFTMVDRDGALGTVRLGAPGEHNVRNALAAFAAARHLGADFASAVAALERFTGVARRFDVLGERAGVKVVDDYAHHHTELAATLAAARAAHPRRRIVAVFQPHLFTRTRDFAREMGSALAAADAVWVTDVYPAREEPIAGVTGELVAAAAREAGGDVVYHPDLATLPVALRGAARSGDVMLVMGAGNIDEVASALFAKLGEEVA